MRLEKVSNYLGLATNVGVLVGLVFVAVQLRQTSADIATSNNWAMVETSNAVWSSLVASEELAQIELKVRKREPLGEVETIRYEAYIWMRLEQVWTTYDLWTEGIISDAAWKSSLEPNQARAASYAIVASTIREGPMPAELKALLLSRVTE